ncbi:MAG: PH domain-containing protein [Clostridia bacterium]|nr:PH domain-containing protein [Clostridia bacterium]
MSEKKQKDVLPDEIFKFKFSNLMLGLLVLLLVLCAAGIGLTTWQFVDFLKSDLSVPYDWIKYILLYLVSILLAVIVIAMLIKSRYIVTEKQLIMQFGIIRSRYAIKDIYSVRLFRGSNKLTVYFDDYKTKFMVIVVKDSWYSDFVEALTKRNEKISFDFITPEEERDQKKKK